MDRTKAVLLLSEQESTVLAKNVFKCFGNYTGLLDYQKYLKEHHLNVLRLHEYTTDDGSKDPLICVNAYTHAHNSKYNNVIELAKKNLFAQARSQLL